MSKISRLKNRSTFNIEHIKCKISSLFSIFSLFKPRPSHHIIRNSLFFIYIFIVTYLRNKMFLHDHCMFFFIFKISTHVSSLCAQNSFAYVSCMKVHSPNLNIYVNSYYLSIFKIRLNDSI